MRPGAAALRDSPVEGRRGRGRSRRSPILDVCRRRRPVDGTRIRPDLSSDAVRRPARGHERMYSGSTLGGQQPMLKTPIEYAFAASAVRFGTLNCRSRILTWYSIP